MPRKDCNREHQKSLPSGFSNYVEFIRLQLTYPDFPVSQNVDWEINLHHRQNPQTRR